MEHLAKMINMSCRNFDKKNKLNMKTYVKNLKIFITYVKTSKFYKLCPWKNVQKKNKHRAMFIPDPRVSMYLQKQFL